MKLTVGSTTIEITHAEPRRDLKFGTYLAVTIPRANTTEVEIDTIFDGGDSKITITKDDGTEILYSGYSEVGPYSRDKDNYYVGLIFKSDDKFQLDLLANEVKSLKKENAEYKAKVEALNQEMLAVQLATVDLYEKNLASEVVTEEVETSESEGEAIASESEVATEESEV